MSSLNRLMKKNENGSATIEFLGMVPFVFLLLVMLWQFFAAGFAVMTAQSAANEAAKVYSTSEDAGKALQAAEKVVHAAGKSISFDSSAFRIEQSYGTSSFTAVVGVDLDLVFLPNSWHLPSIPIHQKAASRVIQ